MNTNEPKGLTSREAAQRQPNVLPKSRDGGIPAILRRNALTLFNLLNLALAGLLLWVGSYRDMLFVGVVLANTVIGVVQELRAKRTHDRLKLLSESPVRVWRDGQEIRLPPESLVEGDVVVLSRGEQIPADARVLEGGAQADESMLTGESRPAEKAAGDTLYSGSFLVGGSVTAQLTAVGENSYAGRLQVNARKVHSAQSQLMLDMRRLIRWVSIAIVPIGAAVFLRQRYTLGLNLADAVTGSVAAVLGMIPEGLILLTSVSLAAGVVKLGRRNTLVNQLYGIETLARTDVVCMDKTGTLTSGEMRLTHTVPLGEEGQIAPCMAALISSFADDNPTNRALRQGFEQTSSPCVLGGVPFSSQRKWSAVQLEGRCAMLGAPEKLLTGPALELAQQEACQGARVLALVTSSQPLCGEALPGALQPLALLCLMDSLRPHVQETVQYFGRQGVSLRVLSGDNARTVSRAAQAAGIPGAENWVDMNAVSDRDYDALCEKYVVFGRVTPEDKRCLVEALRRRGHGVTMVGDGVNDIPALKAADCSIAMAGGSDAASRVAQMTLLDADFNILPQIMLEGRRVINNITRAASLFLVKNLFSLFLSIALMVLPFDYPFAPIQLTLISSLTIGFPSFVLALQPSDERVRGNFLRNVIMRALPGGVSAAALLLALLAAAPALSYSADVVSTLSTYIAGYSGVFMLLLTCLPLNRLRAGLVALMAGGLALAVTLFPKVFYLTPVTGSQWWLLLAAAVLAPAIQLSLGAVIGGQKPRRHFHAARQGQGNSI